MAIIGIVAVAQDLAIGKDGKLPWHYTSDLKHFKKTTLGNTIVMGYSTWLSIGKALPKRLNVVMTRTKNIEYQERVLVLRRLEDAIVLSKYINGNMYIIGGSQIYRSFAHVIEKWVVTEIPLTVPDADAFMPADFLEGFTRSGTTEIGEALRVNTYTKNQ
ncbi:MAG: dihydrofolate reductase [Acidobacteriota bacterium]|nr:dihydrofolate reductase [Acidobacteriota bacterium]MDH3527963.1 dihydrofolate reductase [Acidobacteriota bacterium]